MLKRIFMVVAGLMVPSLVAAQSPTAPSAKPKAARRATEVRGEAVAPATPTVRATPATPHPGDGPATRATPATPATPAVPASPSHRPDHAGQGGQGRGNNPRRP